ncbi:HTH Tnp Tc3 2 domain containing protein, partial [Asbolus verrucosus]
RYTETGSTEERSKTSSPRITNKRKDRLLTISARRDPFATFTCNRLQDVTGTIVSARTVRNRLYEVNLKSRRPLTRVPSTPEYRRQNYN